MDMTMLAASRLPTPVGTHSKEKPVSGIIRNLFTIIRSLFSQGDFNARSRVSSHFLVTPFDTGISVLKSDKYLQLAESAQLDFIIKTKLIGKLLKARYRFVNASQLVKFMRPVGLFRRVTVETEIIYADEKFAYFSHSLFVADKKHGEVLVKMKFKSGAITVRPSELIGDWFTEKPQHIQTWDRALEAI